MLRSLFLLLVTKLKENEKWNHEFLLRRGRDLNKNLLDNPLVSGQAKIYFL